MGIVATISRIRSDKFEEMKNKKKYPYEYEEENVFIGKSWDIMGYTLVGRVGYVKGEILSELINPQESFMISQNEYMTENLNYISPNKVKELSKKINNISVEEFRKTYEGRTYSAGIMYDFLIDSEGYLDHLVKDFVEVQKLYKKAAEDNNYVAIVIS